MAKQIRLFNAHVLNTSVQTMHGVVHVDAKGYCLVNADQAHDLVEHYGNSFAYVDRADLPKPPSVALLPGDATPPMDSDGSVDDDDEELEDDDEDEEVDLQKLQAQLARDTAPNPATLPAPTPHTKAKQQPPAKTVKRRKK